MISGMKIENTERISFFFFFSWKGVDGLSWVWRMPHSRDENGGGCKECRVLICLIYSLIPETIWAFSNGSGRIYIGNYKRIIDCIVKNAHYPTSSAYVRIGDGRSSTPFRCVPDKRAGMKWIPFSLRESIIRRNEMILLCSRCLQSIKINCYIFQFIFFDLFCSNKFFELYI